MAESEIQPGDVVVLKSGSAYPMTVATVGEYSDGVKAKCVWELNGKVQSELISVAALVKA